MDNEPSSEIEPTKKENRYSGILAKIFAAHHIPGVLSFEFDRTELTTTAAEMNLELPKNLGDLIYSFRFRTALPESISSTVAEGFEWVIELAGRGRYRMIQRKYNRILPSALLIPIKIPDATPEIVIAHAQGDEQALLAKVRYNRLIDLFLRVTAYSLQNHLRTSVPEIGQIETDEVYVGVNHFGEQFAIPVQAKGGNDKIGSVQVAQDLALCRKAFPNLRARPVAVQFVSDAGGETIVMFELTEYEGDIRVVSEKHYRLVPASQIGAEDLERYRQSALGE